MTRANGERFREMVLSRGNTEDLAKMYSAWLGAEPSIEPMLKDRGLEELRALEPSTTQRNPMVPARSRPGAISRYFSCSSSR